MRKSWRMSCSPTSLHDTLVRAVTSQDFGSANNLKVRAIKSTVKNPELSWVMRDYAYCNIDYCIQHFYSILQASTDRSLIGYISVPISLLSAEDYTVIHTPMSINNGSIWYSLCGHIDTIGPEGYPILENQKVDKAGADFLALDRRIKNVLSVASLSLVKLPSTGIISLLATKCTKACCLK